MNRDTRSALVAAALIMVGFGVAAYFMPTLMVAIAEYSPLAAGAVAALFVGAFFLVFWLRARRRR